MKKKNKICKNPQNLLGTNISEESVILNNLFFPALSGHGWAARPNFTNPFPH